MVDDLKRQKLEQLAALDDGSLPIEPISVELHVLRRVRTRLSEALAVARLDDVSGLGVAGRIVDAMMREVSHG